MRGVWSWDVKFAWRHINIDRFIPTSELRWFVTKEGDSQSLSLFVTRCRYQSCSDLGLEDF